MSVSSNGTPQIVLASQSPRRAELLRMLGFQFDVVPADIDETYTPGEHGPQHAQRLAREKAEVVCEQHPASIVIGSDTVVLLDDHVLGKPKSPAEAVEMLLRLQGRVHQVATGSAVAVPGHRLKDDIETVDVKFRPFDEARAHAYVATGEPMDKAGSYGIQGYGAALVEWVRGDYFAVMGLPVQRMIWMLEQLGWIYDFRGLRAR
ncbi:MAG TPA: Maf family protein [Longimicrobiales bacterium]